MIGQPPGHAAANADDVNVDVAVVLAAEGNFRSVRRNDRVRFDSRPCCKTDGVTALPRDRPQIPRVGENDACLAERRLTEQQRLGLVRKTRNEHHEQHQETFHEGTFGIV